MFRRITNVRVSTSAVEQIVELVSSGALKEGERLPPERELIKQLGVSRGSLREAFRALEVMGFIEVKPGRGTFVKKRSLGSPAEGELLPWLIEHRSEVMDLLEMREALEVKAASLAATRCTDEQLQSIRDMHDQMARALEAQDLSSMVLADYRFHQFIIHASGNKALCEVMDNIAFALGECRSGIFSIPGRPAKSLEEHAAVLKALLERDPQGAASSMLTHVRNVQADIEAMAGVQLPVAGTRLAGSTP